MKTLLLAGWMAPMVGPVVRDGGIVFDESGIIAAGAGETLKRDHPDAAVAELGEALVLPGLVNAHVHLELGDAGESPGRPGDGGVDFVQWLKGVISRRIAEAADMQRSVAAAVNEGVRQCLRYGVTSVGDISRMCQMTRPLLSGGPLRVLSYGEVQAMGQRRSFLEARLAAALDAGCASEHLRIGLTPHAPYSIEPEGYQRCLAAAAQRHLPLATHLAESADEAAFLAGHAGPLREFWDFLGGWDAQVPRFEGGPIRLAGSLGLLKYPTLLAHVNYCDDEEMALLADGRASVVYCPRTHAYFGHPPHRWRGMLARGINVCVGTDSRASSPDLNLVEDLRLLHRLAPELSVAGLWAMATTRGARAIEAQGRVGAIRAGMAADMVAFPVRSCDPLAEVLEMDVAPCGVWIGGRRMVGGEGAVVQ